MADVDVMRTQTVEIKKTRKVKKTTKRQSEDAGAVEITEVEQEFTSNQNQNQNLNQIDDKG